LGCYDIDFHNNLNKKSKKFNYFQKYLFVGINFNVSSRQNNALDHEHSAVEN
jgi:hypothetical protein